MSLPDKAFPVSWDQFHRDARALAWRLAGMKQERIRIVVDLPAPFGPRKPTIWPGATVNDTSRMAVTGP